MSEPAADAAEEEVDDGDEADEREEHGADIEGEFEAAGRSEGGGIDDVGGVVSIDSRLLGSRCFRRVARFRA